MSDAEATQYARLPANLTRALLATGGCAEAFLDLGFALRRTSLSVRHYEMAILRVAKLSGCAYQRMQHLQPALNAGWSEADIETIESGHWQRLAAPDAIVLRLVDECVAHPRIADPSFKRALALLGERGVAELILLTGFYMMTARFLEGLDVDLDAQPSPQLLSYQN